jgi:hypothetical protein
MTLDRFWLDWKPIKREAPEVVAGDHGGVETVPLPPVTDALLELDEGTRREVQTFLDALGAKVVQVIPRNALDPKLARSTTWRGWQLQMLSRIFAESRETPERITARLAEDKRQRADFINRWRNVAHGWSKWLNWRAKWPGEAEQFRRAHEDGQLDWLLELAKR